MNKLNIDDFVELCIHYAKTNGIELSHLKLQKILFYLQAWSVGYFNDQLFDELPEAWVNGPVYPSIYSRFKDYKGEAIVEAADCTLEEDAVNLHQTMVHIERDSEQKSLFEAVLDKYMSNSAGELVYQTHRERPWLEARNGCGPFEPSRMVISYDSMKSFYGSIADKHKASRTASTD